MAELRFIHAQSILKDSQLNLNKNKLFWQKFDQTGIIWYQNQNFDFWSTRTNLFDAYTYFTIFLLGTEIVVSGGMSMPQILSTLDPEIILESRTIVSRS